MPKSPDLATNAAIPCAGVIGFPIAHSKSPRIHGYWLSEHGIKGQYTALEVTPEHLPAFVQRVRADENWCGFNATIPHKQNIIPLLDGLTPEAKAIGAVNTVFKKDGRMWGHNTDAYGFITNLKQQSGPRFNGIKTALVIGAGGAARAAVYALKQHGISVCLTNRSTDKAEALAQEFGATTMAFDALDLKGFDLVINTTSLGMQGQPALHLALSALPVHALVYDIVYTPLQTPLLVEAQKRGLFTVTGLGMLLHQAVEGFSLWFRVTPAVTPALEQTVLK